MQYDLNKELKNTSKVRLQWHGEMTRVLVRGEGEKREVNTGDVLEVDLEQARYLLSYSPLWTLEGDTPVDQPYLRRLTNVGVSKTSNRVERAPLTVETVDGLKDKKAVVKALKKLKATFNDQASEAELRELLKEVLASESADVQTNGDDGGNNDGDDTSDVEEGQPTV